MTDDEMSGLVREVRRKDYFHNGKLDRTPNEVADALLYVMGKLKGIPEKVAEMEGDVSLLRKQVAALALKGFDEEYSTCETKTIAHI